MLKIGQANALLYLFLCPHVRSFNGLLSSLVRHRWGRKPELLHENFRSFDAAASKPHKCGAPANQHHRRSHDQDNKQDTTFGFRHLIPHLQISTQPLNHYHDLTCFAYGKRPRMASSSGRNGSEFGGPTEEDSSIISVAYAFPRAQPSI